MIKKGWPPVIDEIGYKGPVDIAFPVAEAPAPDIHQLNAALHPHGLAVIPVTRSIEKLVIAPQ